MHCISRLWYGEILPDKAFSNYLVGTTPERLYIPRFATKYDVEVSFLATTLQDIKVGIYGGESRQRLVGQESKIQLTSIDPRCSYKPIVSLSRGSSAVQKKFAAMNYTLSIHTLDVPAPIFDAGVCDQAFDANTNCACGESLSLKDYFTNAGLMSQPISIGDVSTVAIEYEFVYKSAVCLELIGGESFSEAEGVSPIDGDEIVSCFPQAAKVMDKGDSVDVVINIFERYPDVDAAPWFTSIKGTNGLFKPVVITKDTRGPVDLHVENTVLYIRDLVSGKPSSAGIAYNWTVVPPKPPKTQGRPVDYSYRLTAGSPRTDFPFNWPFQVTAQRLGPEGYSIANKYWYIVVTGSVSNEVPNTYPVSSDPTLIFMVLRDPPGGGSFSSFDQGTTATFGMQIEGM